MNAIPVPLRPIPSFSLRRAVRLSRSVPLTGGHRRTPPPDDAAEHGPVVTVHTDPGCDGADFARRVADALGVPMLDDEIPARVAAAEGVALADAIALDGRAPSPMLQAVLWSGFTTPCPEIIGAAAEADLVTRCFHRTEDVIREAAADARGAVIVGRAAARVLAGHPSTVHVRLTAPDDVRADRLGGADALAAADEAVARYLRHGYRTRLDRVVFDLVVDRLDERDVALVAAVSANRRARETSRRG